MDSDSPDARENPRIFLARFGKAAGKWIADLTQTFAQKSTLINNLEDSFNTKN